MGNTGEERAVETIGSKGERASWRLEKITVRTFVFCTNTKHWTARTQPSLYWLSHGLENSGFDSCQRKEFFSSPNGSERFWGPYAMCSCWQNCHGEKVTTLPPHYHKTEWKYTSIPQHDVLA